MRMGLIPVPLNSLTPTPAIGSLQPVNGAGLMANIPPPITDRDIHRLTNR
jgi:hypothetical protein